MSSVPVYGYCMLVAASLIVLLSMSTDFFVSYVNDILIPCQHDSVWLNNRCVCDNTAGVFAGTYCDECQCENLGICGVVQQNLNSRWGCRCPSHQKWVGTLCNKCYAVGNVGGECRGDCIKDHFGTKCNTVCLPYARSTNGHCQEVASGGGECNACNGHGTCNGLGDCECDAGYFTSLSGEKCLLGCEDAGIFCHAEGGTCRSIGGKLQCICNANYFGKDCDQTCPGDLLPCSGHGTCSMDLAENLICTCNPHFASEDCSLPCPGKNSYPRACSGHGQCVVENEAAICECSGSWESDDCSCSATYSCSGHGACLDDASCDCFDESPPENKTTPEIHFAGGACERCKDHWFGENCQLRCDPALSYNSSVSDGLNIGCNNHGSCELVKEFGVEHILCLCTTTDPDTFCEKCLPEYYPFINLPNMTIAPCSVECNPQTCSYNGICNENYDGTNNMCICETWVNEAGLELDTLDPLRFCSTCKPNWFPSDMGAANRCSEYCAADGELQQNKIIVFPISSTEVDFELNGDKEAIKVCSNISDINGNTRYVPDPDCRVCSGEGKCMADGTCKCSPGTTGEYCDIQCNANEDGTVCSGHGRCIRNALDMWFNPFTSKYRCECTPYDTYTSETRQRLLKRGFQVEPPPSPEFYGKHCGFHCPRYNGDVCTDRGSCETGVAVATSLISVGNRSYPAGSAVFCSDDDECQDISGAFCARLSTPWDSLMDSSSKSFFSNGHDSPGYFTCATSDNCIDSIYSIEWDLFCVNMLNGWYPPVLNTAECVYNEEYECRESVEDFFMNEYDGNNTWCESAEKKLMPPRGAFGVCGDNSYANEEVFLNDNVPICFEYTIDAFCNAQPECIYDQRIAYIRNTDDECDQMKPPCSDRCKTTGNGTCETKTYCRAKMCSDIMFEHNVEKMCIELEEPCKKSGKDWQSFCADAVGKIRVATTLLNSMETFFGCYMYDNRNSPLRITDSVPGGIPINGILSVFSEDITVSEFRQSFIDSRIDVPKLCNDIVDTVEFCKKHLTGVVPVWYNNPVISTKWFLPWIVVCEKGPIGLVSSADAAFKLIETIGKNCKEHYRNTDIKSENENDFAEAETGTESILYTGDLWTKQCLDNEDEQINTIDYSKWSYIPSRCVSKQNKIHHRWGQSRWTPDDVQRRFSASCSAGLVASWIPVAKPVPTLCDMGICGSNDNCIICEDCEAHVVYCSKQELGSPVNCKTHNPCQKGAHCFQTSETMLQSAYYCDVTPRMSVNVSTRVGQFSGLISNHDSLTIENAWGKIPKSSTVTVKTQSYTPKKVEIEVFINETHFSGEFQHFEFVERQTYRFYQVNATVNQTYFYSNVSDTFPSELENTSVKIMVGNTTYETHMFNVSIGEQLTGYLYDSTNVTGEITLIFEGQLNIVEPLSFEQWELDGYWSSWNIPKGGFSTPDGWCVLDVPDAILKQNLFKLAVPIANITIRGSKFVAMFNNSLNISGNASIQYSVVQYESESRDISYGRAYETSPGYAEIPFVSNHVFTQPVLAIHSLEECTPDINWYRICSDRVLGVELNTKPPNGLNSQWSGYAALLSEGRLQISDDIVLKHRDNFTSLHIFSDDNIRTECDGIVQFWDGNVTIVTPFNECKCRGTYGPIIVSTVLVNGDETILTFSESLQDGGNRHFNYPNTTQESGYKDWFFEDDDVMTVRRTRDSAQGTDSNKIRGARWTLEDHSNLRISGWARSGSVANMRLLMGDGSELVTVGTIGNGIFINDKPTNCRIVNDNWWYWQINAKHISEVSRVAEISGTSQKVFDQIWEITVVVDNIKCKPFENVSAFTNITTTTVELKLHSRIAASFHDIPNQKEHECRTACHEHGTCHQWSWTTEDHHCFLHSSRCHEDENCVHGTHTLRALHALPVKYFEVSTSLTDVTSSWARIRAEPIITMPAVCEIVDSSIIDSRWRSTFEEEYEPFDPDVTAVCNSLKSTWRLMPGYKDAVCGETECVHDDNDLKACALWKETHQPVIKEEQCLDMEKYNWTAYCHYRKSFDAIGGRVPFLGGLDLGSIDANGERNYELGGLELSEGMVGLCNSSREILQNASTTCPSMNVDWFSNCFERTSAYEDHCSSECLLHIENMLESTKNDSGLCEKRKEFLDISTNADDISNGLPAQCKCNMENVIVTDFCLIQNAYHDENTINIPELYNSECSYGCIDTLKDSMNRTDWRRWCSDLSDGTIPGVCSKTSCECNDVEFPGVSGPLCELTCPTGISDGKELACSGRNGQCFATEPDELKPDVEKQQEAGEMRSITLKGYDIPTWMKGPDPNMPGRCQCAIGSGLSCSIPCYMCNNGVYGPEMSSQYGICDSFNGICRAFPSFMRYNTKQISDNYISAATTAFESAQGISKWTFPERFIYESDEKMVAYAVQYIIDPHHLKSVAILPHAEITIEHEKTVKNMLRIWPLLCSPDNVKDPDTYNFDSDDTYDFEYLSNSENVTNYGIKMEMGEKRTIKLTQGLDWGSCQQINIDQFWYLCFESGEMHAYDIFDRSTLGFGRWNDSVVNMSTGRPIMQPNPRPDDANAGPLLIFLDGEGPGAHSDMRFAIKDEKTIYAFGGQRKHEAGTTTLYDKLYKISFERVAWDPADVVFLTWELVNAIGPSPAAIPSQIWCFQRDLFIVNREGMYRLILPSSVREGQWSRAELEVAEEPLAMSGNVHGNGNLYVNYGTESWTYDPTLTRPWFFGSPVVVSTSEQIVAPSITNTIGQLVYGQSYGNNAYIDCFIEVTNSSLLVGGNIVASFDQPPVDVVIYLEEWNSISLEISPVQRVRNTISWNIRSPETGLADLNLKDRFTIVDLLERVYMHQARWSIYNMMWMKYHLSDTLDTFGLDITVAVHIEPRNTPTDEFLDLFKSVSTAFFGQLPRTEPNLLGLSMEGEQYKRSLVISANYDGPMYDYEQEIDFDSEIIIVEVNWDLDSLFIKLKQKFGRGYLEWFVPSMYRTWHLLLHLEEWQNSGDASFHSRQAVGSGAFQLYAQPESSSTRSMDFQMSKFLHYSASHCTLSADGECPGTLPYINLPCSGRGRCNIACQCTCEIAKSILESTDNALADIDPINSPWRGKGCELTCPGYDGYNLNSICSDHGTCQADGTCSCPQGFTGDACQFECPTDKGGRICAAHGGCGTKAYELSSFKFKDEQYTDMLAAINRDRYSSALSDYYGSCVQSNYVEQAGIFGDYVVKDSLIFFSEFDAFKRCTSLNKLLKLDLTQELYRQYPIGKCIGIQEATNNRFVSVTLKPPLRESYSTKSTRIFDCLSTDCSIETHEDDDLTIYGIRYKMIAPSFEFDIEYVHGGSSGRVMYRVNDQVVYMDIEWTTTQLRVSVGSKIFGDDLIVDREGSFERVKFVVEDGDFNVWVFPFFVPHPDTSSSVFLAPRYDVNYETIIETLTGYHFLIPSDDTGYTRKLMTREVAESSCDAEPGCLGIIRWDILNIALETLYSLYTDINNLNGWNMNSMVSVLPYTFIKKMSLVYQGRETIDGKCAVVEPGLSKYPKVVFREDYNIPIKDINISLAEDPETSAVIIGDGYWSKCWSNIKDIHTKMGCYTYAKNANVYGFSFSDETNICLVYTGIKDNTKIKLDRYNSESRLSIFDPCEEDASWFT